MSRFHTGIEALRALPLVELVPMIGIPAYWIVMLPVFLVICAVAGMPQTERIGRAGSRALPRVILEYGYWQLRLPLRVFTWLHLTPNMITLLSLLLAGISGMFFAMGRFSAGGWFLAFSASCDALDGTMARQLGMSSNRGEYFDAFIDRYSDFFVAFGLLWYYRNVTWIAVLVAAGIIGSQAMGYAKAKGEAVGIDPKVGIMQRHERCVYLLCAAVLSPIVGAFVEPFAPHPTFHLTLVALAIIAVFTNITAVWRAAYVMKRMVRPVPSGASEKMPAPAPAELEKQGHSS